jgi:tetratricopeptide (TPR) repeat protein
MSESPNKLIKFWQELKRRKTGKVIVAYAATAFILLQLADILTPALLLPAWTTRLVTLLLIIGFPIAVIFSWVFDITPEGIKKTESLEESEDKEPVRKPVKRIFSASNIIIAALIIVVGILAYPKIFKRDTLEKLRSSGERITVAVMPFQNMTNDTIWDVWQDGIQDILINSISNSDELRVRQAEDINGLVKNQGITNYASISPTIASTIAHKLDTNLFIYGNVKQIGTTIRLYAQLIDTKSNDVFKSFQIEGNNKEEKTFQLIDSLSLKIKNFLVVSNLIKEGTSDDQKYLATTTSPQAYIYSKEGDIAFAGYDYTTAINLYLQSMAIDSNYSYPLIYISYAYGNQGLFDDAKKWCLKAYEKRNLMTRAQKTETNTLYAYLFETVYEGIRYIKQALEYDDQLPRCHADLGWSYNTCYQYDKAISEFERALEIYNKWDVKPFMHYNYTGLGYAYHKIGQYKKEKKLYKRAEQDFPDDPDIIFRQAVLALSLKDARLSNEYIKKFIAVNAENGLSETDINSSLGWLYNEADNQDKAEELFRQTLLSEPEAPDRINDLAWFLIDNDRNINEGLDLVDKALELNPENFNYLHTLGWGLYKQGKYQEALEMLQKSWDIRREKAVYDHTAFLHLEAAKKAVAGQKTI